MDLENLRETEAEENAQVIRPSPTFFIVHLVLAVLCFQLKTLYVCRCERVAALEGERCE